MTGTGRIDGRTLRYAGRRDELLDAVTAYVIEHGVAELSMRPLAKAVGVSHASLLHHFGSKENLLAEVIERMRGESIPVELTAEKLDNPMEILRTWWQVRMQPAQLSRFRVMLEIYVQAVLKPDQNPRFLDRFVGQWLTVLESGLRAAGCPDTEVSARATLILAQVRGLTLDLLATGDQDRVNRAFETYVDALAVTVAGWSRPS
ncbi:TetR family transcriptional regulator [Rhodococcus sp. RD6.2]|uniref:TetR/AcrR family transcriptional regulator n=1 Tax=Rhodococcus sp. RD6.2 TaxID=260936 RepID=UPI00063B5EF7|nr:TetR/AcrR family transcriptional regulator [Rhodococcus sp. RD6.2]CRK53983.1 TetR family transcriptional regulator [Rhodococcus sp. RD6.2]